MTGDPDVISLEDDDAFDGFGGARSSSSSSLVKRGLKNDEDDNNNDDEGPIGLGGTAIPPLDAALLGFVRTGPSTGCTAAAGSSQRSPCPPSGR